jgi:hypothetical protein
VRFWAKQGVFTTCRVIRNVGFDLDQAPLNGRTGCAAGFRVTRKCQTAAMKSRNDVAAEIKQ